MPELPYCVERGATIYVFERWVMFIESNWFPWWNFTFVSDHIFIFSGSGKWDLASGKSWLIWIWVIHLRVSTAFLHRNQSPPKYKQNKKQPLAVMKSVDGVNQSNKQISKTTNKSINQPKKTTSKPKTTEKTTSKQQHKAAGCSNSFGAGATNLQLLVLR